VLADKPRFVLTSLLLTVIMGVFDQSRTMKIATTIEAEYTVFSKTCPKLADPGDLVNEAADSRGEKKCVKRH
jgi:hypothetical protein